MEAIGTLTGYGTVSPVEWHYQSFRNCDGSYDVLVVYSVFDAGKVISRGTKEFSFKKSALDSILSRVAGECSIMSDVFEKVNFVGKLERITVDYERRLKRKLRNEQLGLLDSRTKTLKYPKVLEKHFKESDLLRAAALNRAKVTQLNDSGSMFWLREAEEAMSGFMV